MRVFFYARLSSEWYSNLSSLDWRSKLFDRNDIVHYPTIKYRTEVLHSVLWRQVATVLALGIFSAFLMPLGYSTVIPLVMILFSWAVLALMTKVQAWRLGNKLTSLALEHGSELVGPHSHHDINQQMDEMSDSTGCERPRFFSVPPGLNEISPAGTWIGGGRFCIGMSEGFLLALPHLSKYILAHEFAHILLGDLRIKHGVLIGNMLVLSTAVLLLLWCLLTLTWAVTFGCGPLEFMLRQVLLLGSLGLIPWLWSRTNHWLSQVMHANEYAADEIGAALAGSRESMADALHVMAISHHGPESLNDCADSHPSTSLRIQVLLQGFT